MKTKLTIFALVALHWITMAGLIAQECWRNRYAGNFLVVGLIYWVLLGMAFNLASAGYMIGGRTPSMTSAARNLTKKIEPAWWRGTLQVIHCFVLFFVMLTGHWWCAVILTWLWLSAKITIFTANWYLKVD